MSANEKVRRINERYRILKQEIKEREEEIQELRRQVIGTMGLGKYQFLTVYSVGETRVRAYKRSAYTAVRAITARVE